MQRFRGNPEEKKYALFNNFSGGVNTTDVDEAVYTSQFRVLENVELIQRGALQNRKGFAYHKVFNEFMVEGNFSLDLDNIYFMAPLVDNKNIMEILPNYDSMQDFYADNPFDFEVILLFVGDKFDSLEVKAVRFNKLQGYPLTVTLFSHSLSFPYNRAPSITSIEYVNFNNKLYLALGQLNDALEGFLEISTEESMEELIDEMEWVLVDSPYFVFGNLVSSELFTSENEFMNRVNETQAPSGEAGTMIQGKMKDEYFCLIDYGLGEQTTEYACDSAGGEWRNQRYTAMLLYKGQSVQKVNFKTITSTINTYRPNAYEISNIGFNILAGNPLDAIEPVYTSAQSIRTFWLTKINDFDNSFTDTNLDTPLYKIPNNADFILNVLTTGDLELDDLNIDIYTENVDGSKDYIKPLGKGKIVASDKDGNMLRYRISINIEQNKPTFIEVNKKQFADPEITYTFEDTDDMRAEFTTRAAHYTLDNSGKFAKINLTQSNLSYGYYVPTLTGKPIPATRFWHNYGIGSLVGEAYWNSQPASNRGEGANPPDLATPDIGFAWRIPYTGAWREVSPKPSGPIKYYDSIASRNADNLGTGITAAVPGFRLISVSQEAYNAAPGKDTITLTDGENATDFDTICKALEAQGIQSWENGNGYYGAGIKVIGFGDYVFYYIMAPSDNEGSIKYYSRDTFLYMRVDEKPAEVIPNILLTNVLVKEPTAANYPNLVGTWQPVLEPRTDSGNKYVKRFAKINSVGGPTYTDSPETSIIDLTTDDYKEPDLLGLYFTTGTSEEPSKYYKWKGTYEGNINDFEEYNVSEEDIVEFTFINVFDVGQDLDLQPIKSIKTTNIKMLEHHGRLLIYDKNTMWFSDLYKFDYFPNNNYVILPLRSDDEIVKIAYFRGSYIILTKHTIYRMSGVFGTDEFSVTLINNAIGCISAKSVRSVNNNLVFLTSDGLYSLKQNYYMEGLENVEKINPQVDGVYPIASNVEALTYREQLLFFVKDKYDKYEQTIKQYYNIPIAKNMFPVSVDKYAKPITNIFNLGSNLISYRSGHFYIYDKGYSDFMPPDVEEENRKDYFYKVTIVTPKYNLGYPTHDKKYKNLYVNTRTERISPLSVTVYVDGYEYINPSQFQASINRDREIEYTQIRDTNIEMRHAALGMNPSEDFSTYFVQYDEYGQIIGVDVSNTEILEPVYNVNDFEIGVDKLGTQEMQTHKLVISGKGKTISFKIEHLTDEMIVVHNLGILHKLGKVKEG